MILKHNKRAGDIHISMLITVVQIKISLNMLHNRNYGCITGSHFTPRFNASIVNIFRESD